VAADEKSTGRVLLAIDGEAHTNAAIERALAIADERGLEITAVHVKDPYLKQFSTEIYAQGREEYLDHVERCLAARAADAVEHFATAARSSGAVFEVKVLEGDPISELVDESKRRRYAMLLVGSRNRTGFSAWRSRDLPRKVASRLDNLPVVVVSHIMLRTHNSDYNY
jgi:nucleotide-binding universal stress UspA family protein